MVLLLKCILDESLHLQSIKLIFVVSGHSFLFNDSYFEDAECVIKKQNKIFSPQDYINVQKVVRRERPIEIYKMEKEDFVSTKKLEKEILNMEETCATEKIN